MARTELFYFVQNTVNGWVVRCESLCYGPYRTFQDALEEAVDEAEAAGQAGFASMVLVPIEDRLFEVQWAYGEDAYPMPPCGRA